MEHIVMQRTAMVKNIKGKEQVGMCYIEQRFEQLAMEKPTGNQLVTKWKNDKDIYTGYSVGSSGSLFQTASKSDFLFRTWSTLR